MGYFACIVYPDALIVENGQRVKKDITVRYWHMDNIAIPTVSNFNSPVNIYRGNIIGTMGRRGVAVTGVHLHVECDTDTTPQYVNWTPTHFRSPHILQNGTDTTINPGMVFQANLGQDVVVSSSDYGTWVLDDDYQYIGNFIIR